MQIDTPEGKLTIDDEKLTLEPFDNGPTVTVPLSPMPDFKYERGIYGTGGLVIGKTYISLRNEDAEAVVSELRRDRRPKAAPKRADTDTAK